jgi:signal transduction histidine kinase
VGSATRRTRDERTALSGRVVSSSPVWARAVDRLAHAASAVGLERWARLVAVAVVPLFLPDLGTAIAPLYGALTAYVLVTAVARRGRLVRGADLVVAAILIAATGGQVAPFLLFLMVAVAGPASSGGIRAGLAAGTVLSVVLLTVLGLDGQLGQLGWQGALPIASLLPLAGITTASAVQLSEERSADGRHKLQEANRLLSALLALAGDLPGGLDVTTVAAGVLAEVRKLPETRAAMVLVEDGGVLRLAAATGERIDRLPSVRVDVARRLGDLRLRTPRQLPAGVRDAAGAQPFWLGVQLGGGDQPLGLLLVGVASADAAPGLRTTLASLAVDAAIALQNARLLDGTLVRAAEAARRRLAADLHDGVAQSLAHLKMELELQTVAGGRRSADAELGRLARVAGSALADLRATIAGLRASDGPDLAVLLRTHLEEVASSGGPSLSFEAAGTATLPVDRSEDLLRIAQEAVSNALRHARATAVTVSLERDEQLVELVVEDDGVGRDATTRRAGGGVGLRSMAERAERLGGTLTVRDRLGGGTVVAVRCPPHGARAAGQAAGALR